VVFLRRFFVLFLEQIEVLNGLLEMHLMMDGATDPKFVPEASFEADSNDSLEVETNLWDTWDVLQGGG
jgi:hypothetical protein